MYGESDAPTTASLVNAGWSPVIKSFAVTCNPLPATAVDLNSQLLTIKDQVVNQPYTITGTIRNVGTAATRVGVPVALQFDFGRNGFTDGVGNDFTIRTTLGVLAAGASIENPFRNIGHSQLGAWQVRLRADPGSLVETSSVTRGNNNSTWEPFMVTVAPGTPTLNLVATSPVPVGENIGLGWLGNNILSGSCIATGAWTGGRSERGFVLLPTTAIGTLTYTLSCVGTNNQPITDTAVVQVIGSVPDLSFANVTYTTCTPAQQNKVTGACPNTTLSFVIRNQGTAVPATEAISYQVDRVEAGAWVPVRGAAGRLAGLGAGRNSRTITASVPNLPAGTDHRFRLQVNNPPTRNNGIGEINFRNNATSTSYFTLAVPPPDYRFTLFDVTGTCPSTGNQNATTGVCPRTNIRMNIINSGADTPTAQPIEYVLQRFESGSWVPLAGSSGTIPNLDAGESQMVNMSLSNLGVGAHRLRGVVNPTRDIDLEEVDFSNNASIEDSAIVPALPPQCNNNNRDDDTDGVADRTDPGCYGTGNPNVPADYDPTDDSEADSSAVVPVPSVFSLTASNQVIRFDTTATIRYQITNAAPMNCELSGPGVSQKFVYKMNDVIDQTLPPSSKLKSTQTFTLSCTPTLIGPAITRTLQVEVIPQVQEI